MHTRGTSLVPARKQRVEVSPQRGVVDEVAPERRHFAGAGAHLGDELGAVTCADAPTYSTVRLVSVLVVIVY